MIKVERTHDKELIKSIITREDIWSVIAEDGQEVDDFKPECDSDCWLVVNDDNLTVGLYNLHPENRITLEAHIHILPEYRRDYAHAAGVSFFKWFMEECPEQYHKLIVKIPALYPNVRRFVEAFGLKLEGTWTESHLKDGNLVDLWLLSITKPEIGRFLSDQD